MKKKVFAFVVIVLAILAIFYKCQKIVESENDSKVLGESGLASSNDLNDSSNLETSNSILDEENVVACKIGEENKSDNEVNTTMVFTSSNFDEEVLKSEKTVIVDFYADWCGPCKVMSPIVEEIANENSNLKVGKVNIDNEENLTTKYNVEYIPTIIIIKNGEVVNKIIGLQDKNTILEKVP